jgi:hypothetical protein
MQQGHGRRPGSGLAADPRSTAGRDLDDEQKDDGADERDDDRFPDFHRGVRAVGHRVEDEPADHCADEPDDDVAEEPQPAAAYNHAGQQTGDQADHQPGDEVVPADPAKASMSI